MLLFGGSDGGSTTGGGEAVDSQLWRLSLTPAEASRRPSAARGYQVAPPAQLGVGSRGGGQRDEVEAGAEAEAEAGAGAEAGAEARLVPWTAAMRTVSCSRARCGG